MRHIFSPDWRDVGPTRDMLAVPQTLSETTPALLIPSQPAVSDREFSKGDPAI